MCYGSKVPCSTCLYCWKLKSAILYKNKIGLIFSNGTRIADRVYNLDSDFHIIDTGVESP